MIKISKSFLFNPAQIWVSGMKCNFKNIAEIVGVLDCKWVVMTIDSLAKDSSLLAFIKKQEMKCFLKKHDGNYIEVSVLIPYSLLEGILEKAIGEGPENIFIIDLLDPTSWDVALQHSFKESVAVGITDFFISISLDENALLISANKFLIQPQELYRKIKASILRTTLDIT